MVREIKMGKSHGVWTAIVRYHVWRPMTPSSGPHIVTIFGTKCDR
jgi:hypothetical protein